MNWTRRCEWHRCGCSKPKDLSGNRPGDREAEVVSENCRELCDYYKFLLLRLPSVGVLPRPVCSLRCCGIFSAGVVKLNNCRGISGRDRRLDEPRIFAQPATLPGAKNVNLTKPAGRFGSPTGRSDSRPQATPSRTETEALSGFLALDHTTFRDALKMFGRRFG